MIEVPVLRLGLAGFSESQQKVAADVLRSAESPRATWQLAPIPDADAWWLDGGRTLLLPTGLLRVQPGVPSGRSVQIALADVDRPVAFTKPLAHGFTPAIAFDVAQRDEGIAVLNRFEDLLQTMLSQFCLAASIAQHQPTLGSGSWEVLRGKELLAVVDLRLGAGVAPGVTAFDFEHASWCIRDHGSVLVPPSFPRASVSLLMWQYALRTQRDLLPPHYRVQPLYFRRPPRLPQQQMRDAHLLLLRELATQPGMNFQQLQQSTGLGEQALARNLSALYVVGSITANAKRVRGTGYGPSGAESVPAGSSVFISELSAASVFPDMQARRRPVLDMTAPAPLMHR